MTLVWQEDLNTGIDVIDHQHRRIVTIANALREAQAQGDRDAVALVLEELVDYTLSHFTFEEALMEDAGYEFVDPHKRLHDLFAARIRQYKERFRQGEDIANELQTLLTRWLFEHIRHDDRSYVDSVRRNMLHLTADTRENGWLAVALRRFFGHKGA